MAIDLARPDQGLRTSYASYLIEVGRPDEALRQLALEKGEPAGERVFYEAAARYERNTGDDRRQAVALLRWAIASGSSDHWDDAHILLVQWATESKKTGEVREEIMGSRIHESNPLVFHTLRGWLSSADGDRDAAVSAFDDACKAVTDRSSREHMYLLAQALVSVGDDERAMPLLLRCYRPGRFDAECRKLLDCAHRVHRHEVSYRVCRELREAPASPTPGSFRRKSRSSRGTTRSRRCASHRTTWRTTRPTATSPFGNRPWLSDWTARTW